MCDYPEIMLEKQSHMEKLWRMRYQTHEEATLEIDSPAPVTGDSKCSKCSHLAKLFLNSLITKL